MKTKETEFITFIDKVRFSIDNELFVITDDDNVEVQNPYSKDIFSLTPIQIAVYDKLLGCEITNYTESYLNCKMIFLKYWTELYYGLID